MQYFLHSEPGDGHANEDAALVQPHPQDAQTLLYALADGMGGRAGGWEAAQIAVHTTIAKAGDLPLAELRRGRAWEDILRDADNAVLDAPDAGYTTTIALCVQKNQVIGAANGDSAVFLLSDGKAALLTDKQQKNPPIGSGGARPTAFSARLGKQGKLLVLSDGVWKGAGWEEVERLTTLFQGQILIAALLAAAREAGGGRLQDDFTVALLQSL